MPRKPPSYRAPGHQAARSRQDSDRRRGSAQSRGYGAAWQRFRAWFLLRHPLCAVPGCVAPATDVDHIVPVSGPDDPRFLDENAVQALCHSCHARKTAAEDGGFGHRKRDLENPPCR